MHIEQFVMAYGVEQDRLRAILPEGFASLRPVVCFNAEVWDGCRAHLEFLTAVSHDGRRGWLNIGCWEDVLFEQKDGFTTFRTEQLTLTFRRAGIQGGCPAERDNDGCYFLETGTLRPPEDITAAKEFCDCTFQWNLDGRGTGGRSIGKTLPAIPTSPRTVYPRQAFTVAHAAVIPCEGVLGSYVVEFVR